MPFQARAGAEAGSGRGKLECAVAQCCNLISYGVFYSVSVESCPFGLCRKIEIRMPPVESGSSQVE